MFFTDLCDLPSRFDTLYFLVSVYIYPGIFASVLRTQNDILSKQYLSHEDNLYSPPVATEMFCMGTEHYTRVKNTRLNHSRASILYVYVDTQIVCKLSLTFLKIFADLALTFVRQSSRGDTLHFLHISVPSDWHTVWHDESHLKEFPCHVHSNEIFPSFILTEH